LAANLRNASSRHATQGVPVRWHGVGVWQWSTAMVGMQATLWDTLAREQWHLTQPFPVPASPLYAQWNDGDGVPMRGVPH